MVFMVHGFVDPYNSLKETSFAATEAEVEQFRKNYVTMVLSWLFIPRVAVTATADEIRELHPKITKVE